MAAAGKGSKGRELAEQIGLAALVFMTEDGERLERFLVDTGLSPADLSRAAGSPETLASVLDYLLQDESMLMVFAAGAEIDPASIAPARAQLPGGTWEGNSGGASAGMGASRKDGVRKPSRRWAGPGAD